MSEQKFLNTQHSEEKLICGHRICFEFYPGLNPKYWAEKLPKQISKIKNRMHTTTKDNIL